MRNILLILAFGILLFGCVNPPPETNTTNVTNTTIPVVVPNVTANETNETTEYVLPPRYTVKEGDLVKAWYTLWVDGEVYDTNNATLANESGIYNPRRTYQPLNFRVNFNSGTINGFILNLLGMELNETLVFTVEPELGYGNHDPSKIIVVPRYYNKSIFETIPRSYFEDRGLEIENGTSFESPYGMVFVDSYNDENVTIGYVMPAGSSFSVNGIPQQVHSLDNVTAKIEFMMQLNSTYILPHPETGAPTQFTVTDKTDENITLDGNHPLAGETLRFSVTAVDIIPSGVE